MYTSSHVRTSVYNLLIQIHVIVNPGVLMVVCVRVCGVNRTDNTVVCTVLQYSSRG